MPIAYGAFLWVCTKKIPSVLKIDGKIDKLLIDWKWREIEIDSFRLRGNYYLKGTGGSYDWFFPYNRFCNGMTKVHKIRKLKKCEMDNWNESKGHENIKIMFNLRVWTIFAHQCFLDIRLFQSALFGVAPSEDILEVRFAAEAPKSYFTGNRLGKVLRGSQVTAEVFVCNVTGDLLAICRPTESTYFSPSHTTAETGHCSYRNPRDRTTLISQKPRHSCDKHRQNQRLSNPVSNFVVLLQKTAKPGLNLTEKNINKL